MPYVTQERRIELETLKDFHGDAGDLNYLFTVEILKEWNANPRYATIHRIKRATQERGIFESIDKVFNLGYNIHPREFEVAADLAFLEFYIRVGRSYENEAINKNGDIEGYIEAYKHLNELARERFNKNIKYVPKEEQPK